MSRIADSRNPRQVSVPAAVPAALAARLAAATAILLLAAACWLPTFDPDVSGSELTVRKLGEPVARFTLENMEMDEAESFRFLPERREVPIAGFMKGLLISERGRSLSFSGVEFDPSFDMAYLNTYWERRSNTFGSDYFAQISPDGYAVVVAELPFINTLNLSTSIFSQDELPVNAVTLGLGTVARPDTIFFEWALVNRIAAIPAFELLGWDSVPPVFNDPTPGSLVFPEASSVTVPGKFLYSGAFNFFYLSCGLADGSRAIFRWINLGSAPDRFPEDHGPLIGGLADGRLLAEQDGLLSVLDPDLERLFAFRSGSLRFVHERWDGLQMITVFTRTLYVRDRGGSGGTLRVEIYEIPSSELYKLGE